MSGRIEFTIGKKKALKQRLSTISASEDEIDTFLRTIKAVPTDREIGDFLRTIRAVPTEGEIDEFLLSIKAQDDDGRPMLYKDGHEVDFIGSTHSPFAKETVQKHVKKTASTGNLKKE